MERRELSCGGQTYCGDFGTALRLGSSLSSTCLAVGRTFPSTTRQEVETGMTSGFCSLSMRSDTDACPPRITRTRPLIGLACGVVPLKLLVHTLLNRLLISIVR